MALRRTNELDADMRRTFVKKSAMNRWRERITNNRYFYHYLFWGIVLLSYAADAAELRQFDPVLFAKTLILKNGLLIALVYFHLRVLVPALLERRQYSRYALALLLTIAVATALIHLADQGPLQVTRSEIRQQPGPEPGSGMVLEVEEEVSFERPAQTKWLLDLLTVCRYLVISMLLRFIDDFFRQREQLQRVQHEKTLAELHVLKAQVQPHFLFNTLNNLYGLVLERSDLAAESMLKLADMLKYTLSEGEADQVPLERDLENLRHYFDLECLRLADTSGLTFSVEGKTGPYRIAPLLLLPIVENAFKYGVHASRGKPELTIAIRMEGNRLILNSLNGKPGQTAPAGSLGLGLQQLRKRLEWLYPGKFLLKTGEDSEGFSVFLQVELENNP